MYQASEEFLAELKQNSRFEHIRGTIGDVSFTDSNIISMSYTNRASDTKDVSFGLAYVGQLKIVLCDVNISRGSFKNLKIAVEFGLTLIDENEEEYIEWIPCGEFFVAEALWTDTGINITANDAMSKFDKAFSFNQTSGTVYNFLTLACQECGVTLGMTAIQCAALPNGTEVLGLYPTNDIKTWRDFLGWIAQVVGGFATIDRSGHLVVRSWADSEIVDGFTASDRITGSSFSDYETKYGGISVVNIEESTTTYYGTNDGAVINLGSNPLLQYGTADTKGRQRNTLALVARGIAWTPFTCSIISNPVYDLGDLIVMTQGVAGSGTLTCCVMDISWTVKQLTTFRGYGADPSLSSAKSKTDKELSGLLSKTTENELVTHTFANAQDFELDENEEVEVCQIHFATVSPKTINLWHEIMLDVEATDPTEPVTCIAHYYLNGEELAYNPTTTWDNDGEHLLSLLYFLNTLEGGQRYDWEVKLEIQNGTATIDTGNIHALLQGQGLVAVDKWDGLVEIEDAAYTFTLGGSLTFNYAEDDVETDTDLPDGADIIDASYGFTLGGVLGFNYEEYDVNVVARQGVYTRITEDGNTRITEGGDTRITEGG